MIPGIQQPFFFPYLEYFAYIKAPDRWIVFDTAQFVNRAWTNRNRVLDQDEGWRYITVPVKKHKLKSSINSILIYNEEYWKRRIISQLGVYKKIAPYYQEVLDFIKTIFEIDFERLAELTIQSIKATCAYIGIDFNYEVFSEMDLQIDPVNKPDEWALNICKSLGLTEFINPFTGQKFTTKSKYKEHNIDLKFLEYIQPQYNQKRDVFEPGLSVIDALMFNNPSTVNAMLDHYKLI